MPVFVSTSEPATLLNGERLYSPSAAARASNIPGHRGGAHVNASTVFRWITRGVRTSDGVLIRLEAVRLSGWKTSLEAIARFSARLTEAALPPDAPPAPTPPTPKPRSRAAARASQELDTLLGTTAK